MMDFDVTDLGQLRITLDPDDGFICLEGYDVGIAFDPEQWDELVEAVTALRQARLGGLS